MSNLPFSASASKGLSELFLCFCVRTCTVVSIGKVTISAIHSVTLFIFLLFNVCFNDKLHRYIGYYLGNLRSLVSINGFCPLSFPNWAIVSGCADISADQMDQIGEKTS